MKNDNREIIISKCHYRILIVDDEPDVLEILSYNLIKAGFETESASDGEIALAKLESFKPDLIILDIMMPKIDGFEVCKTIRMDPKYKNILIVFLTARGEDYTQISALDHGGDDFITKPVKPTVLVSRLKAFLRRSGNTDSGNNSTIIEVMDLTIDPDRHLVNRNGISIDLVKKEFQLLKLLATKPGKVFTREEIFSKVWGHDVIVGNRTIDVHIRKMREKLGEGIIKTIKGVGYKIDAI